MKRIPTASLYSCKCASQNSHKDIPRPYPLTSGSVAHLSESVQPRKPALCIIISLLLTTILFSGCEKLLMEDDIESTKVNTFEYLWTRVDNMYSNFDVKEVDWQAVHDSTLPRVEACHTNTQLFQALADMLNTLNDGHVNLFSSFDVSRCTSLYQTMLERKNIDLDVVQKYYLGYGYHTTGGLAHQCIADSQVVYVRYGSFSNSVSTGIIDYIFNLYPKARGVIFDIRQNGGGEVENVWRILRMFPGSGQLLYTTQIKDGPGRNDFSAPQSVFAPAAEEGHAVYTKPICVLTDRGSYSASSDFALCARTYPNVTLVGDTTGGGLGLPTGGDLPNGWHYRFSVTRTFSPEGVNYENGVPPDTVVLLTPVSVSQHKDNVIDAAASIILRQ